MLNYSHGSNLSPDQLSYGGADYISYNQEEENTKFPKDELYLEDNTSHGAYQDYRDLSTNNTEYSTILNAYPAKYQMNFATLNSHSHSHSPSNSSTHCHAQNLLDEKTMEDNIPEVSQMTVIEKSPVPTSDEFENDSNRESLPPVTVENPSKADAQSIYKNKYKEILEQAKATIEEFTKVGMSSIDIYRAESLKEDILWRIEGDNIASKVKEYEEIEIDIEEMQAKVQALKDSIKRAKAIDKEEDKISDAIKALEKQGARKDNRKWQKQMDKALAEQSFIIREKMILQQKLPEMKKQEEAMVKELKALEKRLKPCRSEILKELSTKRYCKFLPIFEQMNQITQYVKKGDSMTFFDRYKCKRSMKYFESYMQDEELFYWILVLKVVLTFIPGDEEYLELIPLKKSTSPFMLWLLDSSVMKVKHKELFRESYVRKHLRKEFTRIFNILKVKAEKLEKSGKWRAEKWNALQQIINADGENEGIMVENNEEAKQLEILNLNESPKRTFDEYEFCLNEFSLGEDVPCLQKKIF